VPMTRHGNSTVVLQGWISRRPKEQIDADAEFAETTIIFKKKCEDHRLYFITMRNNVRLKPGEWRSTLDLSPTPARLVAVSQIS